MYYTDTVRPIYSSYSVAMLSLSTMLQLELPHVNILSKVDLLESYGSLAYNLNFYTQCNDLRKLVESEKAWDSGAPLHMFYVCMSMCVRIQMLT